MAVNVLKIDCKLDGGCKILSLKMYNGEVKILICNTQLLQKT